MKDRDLFESRSYFAGDDPRKINWKMLALHDELYIKEGSSLSPSRRSALMIIDASGNRSRTDRLFRHFSFLMDTLKDAGLKIDGFLPGEGGVKDLHSLCRTDKEDLLASLPPSAPGRSIPSGPYGVLYFFAAALPGRETLKHLEESFPEARRILVLPRPSGRGSGRQPGKECTDQGGGTVSGLNPALLQKGQNYVLFTAFWLIFTVSSLPLAPLSPGAGLVLFVVLDLLISIVLNRKRVRNTGTTGQMLLIAGVLLVFPLAALSGLLAVRFPFPYDLALLKVRFYLVYLIPALILARFFELAAARFSGSVFLLAPGNLLILSVIMSRSGWALRLPSESLWAAYLLIFLFLVFQSLLLLSGGRRGYRLSFLSAVLVLLIPLLGLVPLSRLQKDESRKEGGGLLESSLFRFDFSDYLSLESSISMKDDLVFLMKKEGVSLKGLTRRFVLSAYSPERGFYKDSDEALESPGVFQNEYVLPESPRSWGYPEFELTGEVIQEYYLVNFDSSAFLGFNSPVSVTPFESWDESSFSRIYSVTSQVSEAWGWDLVDSGALPEDSSENRAFLDYYTRIGEREDLVQLAEEITSESRTYYDHVADIEEYLQNNYYYSLTPGESPEGDQLSHFLYESKKGLLFLLCLLHGAFVQKHRHSGKGGSRFLGG